jgi:TRAP-type C4-dicarboxylate transport system substrate-binding protein
MALDGPQEADVMFHPLFPERITLALAQLEKMRGLASAAGLLVLLALAPLCAASAQERMLRFHHFMPEKSPQQLDIYQPWAQRIARATNGRLKIDVAGGMRLGGKAGELISQVEARTVDIVFTLAGYTPGRFPRLEVFELPWIASSRASATSRALYEFYERYARDDLAGVHLLALWCHPSGVILSRNAPMIRPVDASGRTVRVHSVVIGEAFRGLSAQTKLIPVPQVIKQFQDGAIDSALFPYEIIPTLKLATYAPHITEFAGHRGLYTAVFMIVMNKDTYNSLSEQERKVIDAHSGAALSAELGRVWDQIEEVGRDAFAAAGGEVTFVKGANYDAWVRASEPAIQFWKEKVGRAGINGDKLITAATELVAKYTARPHNE